MIEEYKHFHSKQSKVHINALDFCQNCENPIRENRAKLGMPWQVWAPPTQSVTSIDVYLHAKNQSEGSIPSRDISDQIFLQSDWTREFWAITQEPDFSQTCGFLRMIEDHKDFHFKQ